MNEFLQALRVQKRVITALIFREILAQYGATKVGYLWAIVLPMSQTLVMSLIFWSIGRGDIFGGGFGNITLFIATGFLPLNIFTGLSNQIMQSNVANNALFGYPLVLPFDAMLARLILNTITTLVSFFATLLLLYQLDYWNPEIDSILRTMGAVAVCVLLGFGMGLINAYLVLFFPSYPNVYSILTRPLMFMSGVFFLASDQLPPAILNVLYYNPLLHCTEWLRSAFYNNWESKFTDFNYLFSFTALILFLGLLTQRISNKRSRE